MRWQHFKQAIIVTNLIQTSTKNRAHLLDEHFDELHGRGDDSNERDQLEERGTDSDEVIERRFRDAVDDMSHWNEFDYVVVNDDLDRATAELTAVIRGEGSDLAASGDSMGARVAAILGAA